MPTDSRPYLLEKLPSKAVARLDYVSKWACQIDSVIVIVTMFFIVNMTALGKEKI